MLPDDERWGHRRVAQKIFCQPAMNASNPYTAVFIDRAKKRQATHALGGGSATSTKSVWERKGFKSRVEFYEHTIGNSDFSHTCTVYRDYLASGGSRPTIDAHNAATKEAYENGIEAERLASIAAEAEAARRAREAAESEEELRRELEASFSTLTPTPICGDLHYT